MKDVAKVDVLKQTAYNTKQKQNMKDKRYGTLKGLTVPVLVYESYSEADTAAGKADALLETGNDNLHYRGGPAGDTRAYICDLLEEETGIARKLRDSGKKTKDDAGNEIPVMIPDESEGEYAARVCATKGWEDLKQFQPQIDEWAKTAGDGGTPLAVDAKTPERAARAPLKLAKKYKDAAAVVLHNGTVDRLNANQLSLVGKTFTATNDTTKMYTGKALVGKAPNQKEVEFNVSDKDAEALGWLYKQYRDWKEAQETQEMLVS